MRLTVVRGIPGSGKSTFAREYAATQTRSGVETVHVESDDYFVVGTHYLWDAGLLKAAHQRCYRMTEKLLEQGIAVVVANTFTTTGERSHREDDPALHGLPGRADCTGNRASLRTERVRPNEG
jgi:predicted kinase